MRLAGGRSITRTLERGPAPGKGDPAPGKGGPAPGKGGPAPGKAALRCDGAGCRNRTRDLLITNQLLYQLS